MTGAQGMEGVIDRRGKNAELFRSFATALGVDAVAIVQMDMSYGASGVAVNGFGKARGHVGTGITLVRKDGKVLIESGNPMNTRNLRVESDDALPWLAGDIVYNDLTRKCFERAIQKSAANVATVLNAELGAPNTPPKVAAKK
jgi:hypothetical protein